MREAVVRNQAELDAALADQKVDWVEIRSDRGVWLTVRATGSATVTATGSATVRATGSATVTATGSATVTATGSATVRATGSATVTATGSATVRATGSATVRAYDSATVTATGSATVRATGSATVRATGSATVTATGSATVRATGSATVTATGSATVRAYDSATVTATDSATVTATGSATVRATGSATVTAYDSATVTAYDSATVTATPQVAVHVHSARVQVSGGVVIDVSQPITDGIAWCEHHGINVSKAGVATVYKAVDDRWTTSRGTDYSPGAKPSCDDWRADDSCGGGLHFGPTPVQAMAYHQEATKFVEVGVKVTDLVPISGGTAKCKAPRVVRACREVDIDGKRVSA